MKLILDPASSMRSFYFNIKEKTDWQKLLELGRTMFDERETD